MRINILSPGRFHVLDLARELNRCGHDVAFYSYVTEGRAARFGLPKKCSKSLFWIVFPFLFLSRFVFERSLALSQFVIALQDYATAIYMRKSDVVIAMSGNYVHSIKRAKANGAFVILERGSKHICEQRRILEEVPSLAGKKPVPDANVIRELAGYEIADRISIPSEHVKDSFVNAGYCCEKLFVNPYGVDLDNFRHQDGVRIEYDVMMVGNWCYQKGCDLIADSLRESGLRFLHVGAIGDMEFPEFGNFTHHDPVDQLDLAKYYSKAKVFLLPSRQDGFGMVLAQALACGLPLVCSKDTGGRDIAKLTNLGEWVYVMDAFTSSELLAKIQQAISFHDTVGRTPLELADLSWEAYGRRYDSFLREEVGS